MRVPLIVKWPGKIKPNATSAVQVTGTDHYPTMLEMADVPLLPEQHVDGRSYKKALSGETYQRAPMFWYKWTARPDSTGDTRSISYVEGDMKVIQWLDEDLVELFDLSKDEGEQTSLTESQPEKTAEMLKQLLAMENEVGNLREKGRKQLDRRLERLKEKAKKRSKK
jgi:arylsulfatase A-like enzyme